MAVTSSTIEDNGNHCLYLRPINELPGLLVALLEISSTLLHTASSYDLWLFPQKRWVAAFRHHYRLQYLSPQLLQQLCDTHWPHGNKTSFLASSVLPIAITSIYMLGSTMGEGPTIGQRHTTGHNFSIAQSHFCHRPEVIVQQWGTNMYFFVVQDEAHCHCESHKVITPIAQQ